MRKILVTGGTGLIGSCFLKHLDPQDEVYAVARAEHVPGATHILNIDLGKPWSTSELPHDIDSIVHLAQSEHYREFPNWAEDVFAVNTLSTIKLLEYARDIGVKHFVLASSGGVYGAGATHFSEDEAILAKGELGFYIGTRLCSELLSECYERWMSIVTLRFFFAYGENQRRNMLIPRLVDSVRSGRAIQLKGVAGLSINPVHVSDAVRAVRQALVLKGSHKINVAGPNVLSLRRIAEIIGEAVGKQAIFDIQPATGNADLIGDVSRMKSLLCEPQVNFEQGLRSYLENLTA